MRFNQHLTVLGKHVLAFVHHPIGIVVFGLRSGNVGFVSLLISVVVALPLVVVAVAVLDADIELAILLVGTIDITDIAAAEDVAVLTRQLFRRAYRAAVNVHLCLSEDVTVGIERTAFTEVVVASAAAEDVAVHFAFEECHVRLAGLVDAFQGAHAVVHAGGLNDAAPDGCNLAAAEESVAHDAAVHVDVGGVHAAVVDVAAAEDTTAVVEAVGAVARPGLVVQFLLIVVRAHLNVVEIGVGGGHAVEVAVADETLVERDVGRSEYGAALAAAVGVTFDGRNTVDEVCAVFLADDNVCLTKNVTRCAFTDSASVVTYAASPSAAIDVTCRAALDIGIGRSDERLAEVIGGNVVFVVHRTYGAGSIEVFGYLAAEQSNVGGSVYIAGIGHFCVTQTAAVSVSAAAAAVVHVAADVCAFVDDNVGVVFLAVSGLCQIVVQAGVGIAVAEREVNRLRCLGLRSCSLLFWR